jgi:hypothetical protein
MTKITIEKFTPYERCPTCWRPSKAVTITKEEYDRLVKDSNDFTRIKQVIDVSRFNLTEKDDDEYKSRRHTCDVKEQK